MGSILQFPFNSQLDTRNHRLLPYAGKFFNVIIDGGLENNQSILKQPLNIIYISILSMQPMQGSKLIFTI